MCVLRWQEDKKFNFPKLPKFAVLLLLKKEVQINNTHPAEIKLKHEGAL